MSAADQDVVKGDNGSEGVGCYWVAGTILVLALGIGGGLYIRWHNENFEIKRSRNTTSILLHELGFHALSDFVEAHECLPKSVIELAPYLDEPGGYDGARYREKFERGLDAWGNEVQMYMDTEARHVILISPGPDGHENNSDDVVAVERLPDFPRCPE